MFGLRRTNSRAFTWRDIPNEVVATRARESNWSIGKIRQAVGRESMAIIANLADALTCEVVEVKCERCDFPLITSEELANDVIVVIERIAPNGYVAHTASKGCGERTTTAPTAAKRKKSRANGDVSKRAHS